MKDWNVLNRMKNYISNFSDFYFSSYDEKTLCGRQFWNTVEREPVETTVLNTTASEASYKPEHRSYRKTKLIFFFRGDFGREDFIREPSSSWAFDLTGTSRIFFPFVSTINNIVNNIVFQCIFFFKLTSWFSEIIAV